MNRYRLLLSFLLLSVTFTLGVSPAGAAGDPTSVRINEFSSNSPDFVELINTGSEPMDLSGWVLKDSTDNNSYTFPNGSSIAAGAILGLSGENVDFAFGLGSGDSVRLFAPGAVLIDSYVYPAHPPAGKSYGRCPDGTGDFVITQAATKGAANSCSTPATAVRINEFSSNSPDFVELINTGTGPVDLSGWVLKDNSDSNSYTFPSGSSIAAGAILGLSGENVDFAFGLGGGDSVRLFAPGAVLIDSNVYPSHPPAGKSYGRCPDGTGAIVITAAATKGAANSCPLPAGAANIKVNEIESDPNDLVELTNIGETPVDISGYRLKDNDDTHVFTIAAGTTLAAHGYLVVDVNPSFGLGKGDSVRLYTPDGANLLDSTTYPADTHAATWGRCPDGTGAFGVTTSTLGAANACGPTGPPVTPNVKVNEVESNGDQVADWVELKNLESTPVNVSGWKIVDGDPSHAATPVVVPANTTIPAGGYYAIYTEIGQSPGFGLGVGDSVNLFLADGTTQVDTTTWGPHSATTWGRCPDGTGDFRETTTSTRGLANACSPVRINEIESDGGTPGDWVELKNISAAPIDISGWVFKDNADADVYTIPSGTTIAANGYQVLEVADFGFGLGGADSARLYDASSTLVESYTWAAHALQTYGRCKDGVGEFADTRTPTKGAANSCPGLDTEPWPGSQTVETADLPGTFVQDLSGLVFDPADPDVLWAAQNKLGTLFKMVRDGNFWVPAAGWPKDPKFLGGAGAPDTEGITIGPDGFVYLASERDNSASGVSRMSILRYDPSATGATLTPTNEWNLTSKIPAAGANLGLEGVTWVPDSYLVAGGFVDQSTGSAYTPSSYPQHGTGLYVVAVEDTGDLHAFALDSDGTTSHLVATIDGGFAHLADVNFDPERARLWAVTDDTHDGKTALLKLDASGAFVVDVAYDRPVGMPNLNNEGLAIAPQSRCVAGKKEVLWADDGDTGGNSLRRGAIDCVTPEAPALSVSGVVTDGSSPVAGACVYLYTSQAAPSASFASCTQADGTYVVPAVTAGTYEVAVSDPAGVYETKWLAAPITVDGAETGVDVVLSEVANGAVTGTVTAPSGPVGNVCVFAYEEDVTAAASYASCTLGDGSYGLYGMEGGAYDIAFFDPAGVYPTQWSTGVAGGAPSQAGAVAVSVPGSGAVTVDAVLSAVSSGAVSGTVTGPGGAPVAGVCVYLYTNSAGPADYGTCTQADGSFYLGGVAAGTGYRVGFADPSGVLATQWRTGTTGGAATYAGGVPITVTAGGTTSNVNATMAPAP